METFGGAVQLMLFVYALAAVISLAMAWIIKFIFFVIQMQRGRVAATQSAKSRSSATPANVKRAT